MTGSDISSRINAVASIEHEYDPTGVDTGLEDPANTPPSAPPDPIVPTYTGAGSGGNPACTLDGIEYDCATIINLIQHGVAAIAPPQTTKVVQNPNGQPIFVFFRAFADGTSGFSPLDAKRGSSPGSWKSKSWGDDEDDDDETRGGRGLFLFLSNLSVDTEGGGDENRENKLAPRSGACTLATPDYLDIKGYALKLLERTFGKGAAAFYRGLGTYNQAVFLNTITAVARQGVDLSFTKFEGFYNKAESRAFY